MTAAAPQYIPPQPQGQQPPPQKSGCLKWLLIGCSVLFVLGIAAVAVLVVVVFGAIRSTDAYKGARDRAVNDPRVIAALGAPVETGWWVKGSVNVDNDGGHANITFPISGPKGKATVEAIATRDAEKWVYTKLKVDPDGGPPIDLLQ
jgi:hypothetical protein